MKRRCLLKTIPRRQPAAVLAGFLWAATIACAAPGQAQTSTRPDAATPPQTEVQGTPNTPQKKLAKSGAWHHFGESVNASAAGQMPLGIWHRFGPSGGTPKAGPAETAPQQDFGANRMADLERQMWALLNHDRLNPATSAEMAGRAQPLRWNEKLAAVARAHSRDMLEQGFFAHVDPDGRTLSTRLSEGGIPWQAAGENIAIYTTVPGAEGAFMNEPRFQRNHRGNILNASYTDVGIGIVQGPDGSLYITQDFVATPPKLASETPGSGRGQGGGGWLRADTGCSSSVEEKAATCHSEPSEESPHFFRTDSAFKCGDSSRSLP